MAWTLASQTDVVARRVMPGEAVESGGSEVAGVDPPSPTGGSAGIEIDTKPPNSSAVETSPSTDEFWATNGELLGWGCVVGTISELGAAAMFEVGVREMGTVCTPVTAAVPESIVDALITVVCWSPAGFRSAFNTGIAMAMSPTAAATATQRGADFVARRSANEVGSAVPTLPSTAVARVPKVAIACAI